MMLFGEVRWKAACVICLIAAIAVQAQSTNGVLREVYRNVSGGSIAALTSAPNYPSNPDFEEVLANFFECPTEYADNYGTRLRALLVPPVTGTYYFWVSSDDNGQLWLSTDENPANKQLIATVNSWTSSREYNKEANQKSAGIVLTNGRRYYIEALMAEGGGGDNLAVAWQKPGDSPPANNSPPIPASFAVPYGLGAPIISAQPQNTQVTEGGTATFRVQLGRALGAVYQWQRAGTNLPGATSATLTLELVKLADSGSVFRCYITNAYGWTNTVNATLLVAADTTRPTLVSANNLGHPQTVSVQFSEPVEPASATNIANYQLSNGFAVLGASFGPDTQTIVLRTSPLTNVASVVLTLSNVRDRATTPNTILANSTRTFTIGYTPLDAAMRWPPREPAGPSTRSGPLAITEIMYHPADRPDGLNLEFIEIYNSQPWLEEIDGFRITGAVEFTFPTNTVIPAFGRIVVAGAPADLNASHGLTGTFGPFSGKLQNDSGTLRLRNHLNAVLWEADYSDDPPFPAAADGGGHSLVLARPSYGEKDPRAWAASERVGGSPGTDEPVLGNPQRTVMLNEIMAHTDPPQFDAIELFNYSTQTVNLAGCVLTDDPTTNKFVFPAGATIGALGFVALDRLQLGFGLEASGETVFLYSSNMTRVIDAVKFGGQENGVALGRYPDGADEFRTLPMPTLGTANAPPRNPPVVINEIMFDPISTDSGDEFIELHNPGASPVDLSKWRLNGAVKFSFPRPTVISAGGFLVVGANMEQLRAKHPNLTAGNSLGDFSGGLANRGERLQLQRPDAQTTTNELGLIITNSFYVTVDEARYGGGGRWARWAAGGGSSLELADVRSDHQRAPEWLASDETGKSGWVTIEHTGVLDNGQVEADSLHILLLGEGECLVDNVEVIPSGSTNLVANPDFESGLGGWFFQGTHERSSLESGNGFSSQNSLHLRASARGDTGANRIRTKLGRIMSAGETATIRARVEWLRGHPEILLRLRGSYLEATGTILSASNLGTPGLPNSRATLNGAPAITEVTHYPILPAASQTVTVMAKVHDPDGLATLFLKYRLDPATNWTTISMAYRGAGWYSGTLPAQAAGALAAFYLQASDAHPVSQAATFPDDAPARECLVRWGEPSPSGSLGVYRLWITQATINKWSARERLSNDPLDGTFVYGNYRVIYNAGAAYSGSPYHSPGYNSPLGSYCDYSLNFPPDDRLLGSEELTLQWPGNGGGDGTAQGEQHAYWIGYQLGLPYCYRRFVNVFVNGVFRGNTTLEDVQQPNKEFAESWYPDNDFGALHKVQLWFEYDDAASGFSAAGANLGNFTTSGGVKKLARYRWNWAKRAFGIQANDYARFFALVDAANTTATGETYRRTIEGVTDVDQWARHFLVEKIVGNGDSYGNGGGQNMYIYQPDGGTWKMLIWDIDFAFGSGAPTDPVFNFTDGPLAKIFAHPPFARAYWRAIKDAVDGPLQASRSNGALDNRYNALRANGINASSPDGIKSFVATRLSYLSSLLPQVSPAFQTTPTPVSTNRNLVAISGTAPISVATIGINGQPVPVIWTSVTNWTTYWTLSPGANQIIVTGRDKAGNLLPAATVTNMMQFTGTLELPQDFVVINEIMYRPDWPDASFVEIFNRSATSAFDLSNWQLRGIDFTFAHGTILQPGSFAVVVKNLPAYNAAYGASPLVAGEFAGKLDDDGETLRLIEPGLTPEGDVVIDQVTYENAAPWPLLGLQAGASLQLLDAGQDNNRAANWSAATTNQQAAPAWQYVSASGVAGSGAFYLYLQSAGDAYVDDVQLVAGSIPEAGANLFDNGNFESALSGPWTISANHAGSVITTAIKHGGNASLHVMASSGGTTKASAIWQDISGRLTSGQTYTLSFWYRPGATGGPLTLRFSGSWISQTVNLSTTQARRSTPATPNSLAASLAAFPPLWLNEICPNNFSGPMDRFSEREPWVELYNGGATNLSLAGFHLSDSYTNLTRWAFPSSAVVPAGQSVKVWLDGEPGESTADEWHASFRITANTGAVALASVSAVVTTLVHHLNFSVPGADRTYGLYPDGNASGRRVFVIPTPGASNNPVFPPVNVFINEWMADNQLTQPDPADGAFEDWFELYNAETKAVDLSGYYLTDELANTNKWRIPDGTLLPAGGYRLVWADGEPSQNSGGDLHADFKLSATGELIALFAPDGTLVDLVTFSQQTNDVSEGRIPNGGATIIRLAFATPDGPNLNILSNSPPVLSNLPDQAIPEGILFTFTAQVSDPESAVQALGFSLDPGAPTGATISSNGIFSWLPAETQGGDTYSITVRVTDNGVPPLGDTKRFNLTVDKVNSPPQLTTTDDAVVYEGTVFSFQAYATDADLPPQQVTYRLDANAPAGAQINPTSGLFYWTPSESQGPGMYLVKIIATDNGAPALSSTQSVRVSVLESNQAPSLPFLADRLASPLMPLTVALGATDGDIPTQTLTYQLVGTPPASATLDQNGILSWTPPLQTALTTNRFTVLVTDDGTPPRSVQGSFNVVVLQTNSSPIILVVSNRLAAAGQDLMLTIQAWDAEYPLQQLTWRLGNAPTGATLNATSGVFRWLPAAALANSTSVVEVVVSDDGIPSLSATQRFEIILVSPLALPNLPAQTLATLEREGVVFTAGPATNAFGQPIAYFMVQPPAHGTLVDLGNQTYRYDSSGRFNGTDDFKIGFAINGFNISNIAYAVTVASVNDITPYLFEWPVSYSSGPLPVAVVSADFNRDNKADVISGNSGNGTFSLLIGDGLGGLKLAGEHPAGGVITALATADFNRDGRADLAVAHGHQNQVSIFLGGGDGTFATPLVIAAGSNTVALAVADLDKDNNPDLVAVNQDDGTLTVLLGNGLGGIRSSTSVVVGGQPMAILLNEFTQDNKFDALVAHAGSGGLTMLHGNAAGGFFKTNFFDTGGGISAIATGDFIKDGKLDAAICLPGEGWVVSLMSTNAGQWLETGRYWVGGSPAAIAATDINGDNLLDLIICDGYEGSVKVLVGQTNGTFQNFYHDQGAYFGVDGSPVALAIADLNRDLNQDVVLALWGSDEVGVLLNNRMPRVGHLKLTALEDWPLQFRLKGSTGPLNFRFGKGPTNGTLRLLAAPDLYEYLSLTNRNGRDYLEYYGEDGQKTSTVGRITMTILPINDPPELELSTNLVSVDEDTLSVVIPAFVKRAAGGPADALDEQRQALRYMLQPARSNLFSRQPTIAAGSLRFVPVRNAFGETRVMATVKDNMGVNAHGGWDTSQPVEFTIRINNINDPPTLSRLYTKIIREEEAARWPLVVGDLESPPDELVFSFASTNETLLPASAIHLEGSGSNRVLVAQSATNEFGRTLITVTVSDGTNSTSWSVGLIVNPVNDPPSLALARNEITVPSALITYTNLVVNLAASNVGPTNEMTQKFIFVLSNPRKDLFAIQPAIRTDGNLVFRPRGLPGEAFLEVRMRDTGGAGNGGVDTSQPATLRIVITP